MSLKGCAALVLVFALCTRTFARSVVVGNCDVEGVEERHENLRSAVGRADVPITAIICPGNYSGTENVALTFTNSIEIVSASVHNGETLELIAVDVMFQCNGSWGWAFERNATLRGIGMTGCVGVIAVGVEVIPQNGSVAVRQSSAQANLRVIQCVILQNTGTFRHEVDDGLGQMVDAVSGTVSPPPVVCGEIVVGSGSSFLASWSKFSPFSDETTERDELASQIVALHQATIAGDACINTLEFSNSRWILGTGKTVLSLTRSVFRDIRELVYIWRRTEPVAPSVILVSDVTFKCSQIRSDIVFVEAWNAEATMHLLHLSHLNYDQPAMRFVQTELAIEELDLMTPTFHRVSLDHYSAITVVDSIVSLSHVRARLEDVAILRGVGGGTVIFASDIQTAMALLVEGGAHATVINSTLALNSANSGCAFESWSGTGETSQIIVRDVNVKSSMCVANMSNSDFHMFNCTIVHASIADSPVFIIADNDTRDGSQLLLESFEIQLQTAPNVPIVDLQRSLNASVRVSRGRAKLSRSFVSLPLSGGGNVVYDGVSFSGEPTLSAAVVIGGYGHHNVSVTNCHFTDFSSDDRAVNVISVRPRESLTISDTIFERLSIKSGAIASAGKLKISKVTVRNISNAFLFIEGGSCDVTELVATSNTLTGHEGLVIVENANATLESIVVSKSTHIATSVGLFRVGQGGSLSLHNANLSDIQAGFGAIASVTSGGELQILDSKIERVRALESGGVALVGHGGSLLMESTIVTTARADNGGILAIEDGYACIRNCVFVGSVAVRRGGVASLEGNSRIVMERLSVLRAIAVVGGVFYGANDVSLSVEDSSFVIAKAQYGGVVALDGANSGNLSFSRSVLYRAVATVDGGFVHSCARRSFCQINGRFGAPSQDVSVPPPSQWLKPTIVMTFDGCTLGGANGLSISGLRPLAALSANAKSPMFVGIRNSDVADFIDTADNVVMELADHVEIVFENVQLSRWNGCMMATLASIVMSRTAAKFWYPPETKFDPTESKFGCSISMTRGWLSIQDTSFENVNSVYCEGTSSIISNLTTMFRASSADVPSSPAIIISQGSTLLSDSHFLQHRGATLRGVIIAFGSGEFMVERSSFRSCICGANDAGPLVIGGGMQAVISNTSFTDNAGSTGALLYWGCQEFLPIPFLALQCARSATLHIYDSLFENNTATKIGGALSIFNSNHVFIKNVRMASNQAGGRDSHGSGGAISVDNARLEIERCELSGNTAAIKGGAIAALSPSFDILISNSTITENSAMVGGAFAIIDGNSTGLTLENCMIGNNNAVDGSILYVSRGPEHSGHVPFTVINSTLVPGLYASGEVMAGDAADIYIEAAPTNAFPGDTLEIDLHIVDRFGNELRGPNVGFYLARVVLSFADSGAEEVGRGTFSDFGDFASIHHDVRVDGGYGNISAIAEVPEEVSTFGCTLTMINEFEAVPLHSWEPIYVYPYCRLGDFMVMDEAGASCFQCEADQYSFQSKCKQCPDVRTPCVGTETVDTFRSVLPGFWVSPPGAPTTIYKCAREESCEFTECLPSLEQLSCKTLCVAGYEGRLCGRCEHGYYGVGLSCYECGDHTLIWITLGVGVASFICAVVAATLGYPLVHILCQTMTVIALWMLNVTPLWLMAFAVLLVIASIFGRVTQKYNTGIPSQNYDLQDIDEMLNDIDSTGMERISLLSINEKDANQLVEEDAPLISTGAVESLLFFLQANRIVMTSFIDPEVDFKLPLQLGGFDCLLETTSTSATFMSRISLPCVIVLTVFTVTALAYLLERYSPFFFGRISNDVAALEDLEDGEMHAPIDSAFMAQVSSSDNEVHQTTGTARRRIWHWVWKALSLIVLLTSVIYFEIAGSLLQILSCEFDEGLEKYFMISESDVQCYEYALPHPLELMTFSPSSEWGIMFYLTIAGVVVYIVGIPMTWITMLGFLWTRKRLFSIDALTSFGYLFSMYRENVWWWHVLTILRLLALEAAAAFFQRSSLESPLYNAILVISLGMHAWTKPYQSTVTNLAAAISISFLLIGYNAMIGLSAEQDAMKYIVVAASIGIMLLFLCVLALPVVSAVKNRVKAIRTG